MANVRAKFKCISITHGMYGSPDAMSYRFQPVLDTGIPEDQRYHKYTPSGNLEMLVENPNVHFEIGQDYYLNFTEATDVGV